MDWALIGLPKVKSFCTGGSFSLLLNGKFHILSEQPIYPVSADEGSRGHMSKCLIMSAQLSR